MLSRWFLLFSRLLVRLYRNILSLKFGGLYFFCCRHYHSFCILSHWQICDETRCRNLCSEWLREHSHLLELLLLQHPLLLIRFWLWKWLLNSLISCFIYFLGGILLTNNCRPPLEHFCLLFDNIWVYFRHNIRFVNRQILKWILYQFDSNRWSSCLLRYHFDYVAFHYPWFTRTNSILRNWSVLASWGRVKYTIEIFVFLLFGNSFNSAIRSFVNVIWLSISTDVTYILI